MFKVFNRCLTTRTSRRDETKINILQLFHVVINQTNVDYAALLWIDEDYHSIKDDIPLVSVYTNGNVLVVEGEKDDDDSKDRLELGSHKENLGYVNNDDDEEK
ncbi:hypothetical protein Tco_1059209, partial [Tanacetum coccineum]